MYVDSVDSVAVQASILTLPPNTHVHLAISVCVQVIELCVRDVAMDRAVITKNITLARRCNKSVVFSVSSSAGDASAYWALLHTALRAGCEVIGKHTEEMRNRHTGVGGEFHMQCQQFR